MQPGQPPTLRPPLRLGDVFDTAGVDSGDGVGIYIADS
jgi:hypothetical protein